MGAQIVEHESPRERTVMRFALFAAAGVLGVMLIALCLVALGSLRLPCC